MTAEAQGITKKYIGVYTTEKSCDDINHDNLVVVEGNKIYRKAYTCQVSTFVFNEVSQRYQLSLQCKSQSKSWGTEDKWEMLAGYSHNTPEGGLIFSKIRIRTENGSMLKCGSVTYPPE